MDRRDRRKIKIRLNFLIDRYHQLNRKEKSFIIDFKYHFRKKEISSARAGSVHKLNRLFRKYNIREKENIKTHQQQPAEPGSESGQYEMFE